MGTTIVMPGAVITQALLFVLDPSHGAGAGRCFATDLCVQDMRAGRRARRARAHANWHGRVSPALVRVRP
jgi:hypothetical protein